MLYKRISDQLININNTVTSSSFDRSIGYFLKSSLLEILWYTRRLCCILVQTFFFVCLRLKTYFYLLNSPCVLVTRRNWLNVGLPTGPFLKLVGPWPGERQRFFFLAPRVLQNTFTYLFTEVLCYKPIRFIHLIV